MNKDELVRLQFLEDNPHLITLDENDVNLLNDEPRMSPRFYYGYSSLKDYVQHFCIAAELNCWSLSEMGVYLTLYLRGPARQAWKQMPREQYEFHHIVTFLGGFF